MRINGGVLRTRILDGLLRGHAVQAGAVLSRPLLQRFGRTVTGAVGFDFINVDNALVGYRLADDHTRSARASLNYREESARHLLEANVGVFCGLAILPSDMIEPLAEADFPKPIFASNIRDRSTSGCFYV